MNASWTPFLAAAGTICAVFATAVWRQSQRRDAVAAESAVDVPIAVVAPTPAPAPSTGLDERRAALERLLAAAPMPIGSWEDTAPLTVPPDEVTQ